MFKTIFLWVFLFILPACSVSEKFSNTKESVPLTTENKENVVINNEEKTEIVEEKERKMEEGIELPKVEDNEQEKVAEEVVLEENVKESLNKPRKVPTKITEVKNETLVTELPQVKNSVITITSEQFLTVNDLPEFFNGDKYRITGRVDNDVNKIIVDFENPASTLPKDSFKLKKYVPGSGEWYYEANVKFQTLDNGLNVYTIKAYKGEQESITKVVILNAPNLAKDNNTGLYYQKNDLDFFIEEIEETLDISNLTNFVANKYPEYYWHNYKSLSSKKGFAFYTLAENADNQFSYYINYYLNIDGKNYLGKVFLENNNQNMDISELNNVYKNTSKNSTFSNETNVKIEKANNLFNSFQKIGNEAMIDMNTLNKLYNKMLSESKSTNNALANTDLKNEIDIPINNVIDVDFFDNAIKLDTKTVLDSIGYKSNYDINDQYSEYKRIKIHYVGIVNSGIYQNKDLYVVESAPDCPCPYSIHRLIRNNDNSFTLLNKISDGYKSSEELLMFKIIEDKNTTINNIFTPDTITVPNYKDKLEKTQSGQLLSDKDKNNLKVLFYSNDIKQDIYWDKSSNCFLAKNKDNTFNYYDNVIDFLGGEKNANSSSVIKSSPIINWNDGTVSKNNYDANFFVGCNFKSCYSVVVEENNDLFKLDEIFLAGKTNKGFDVYLPIMNSDIIKNAYGEYVYSNYKEDKDPSIDEFYKNKPIIFVKDNFNRYIEFKDVLFVPGAECGKPVIYLYPEVETDVNVKVFPTGGFTKTEPAYNTGWQVRATPKSEIYNYADKKDYPYLFWEGKAIDYKMPDKGFVIAKSDLQKVLIEKLALLGLNEIETADFMEFWYPKMLELNKPYYFVTFVPQAQFDLMAPLQVKPQPDSIIRVFMDYKGLNEKITVEPLEIKTPKRTGFTVIEWGGNLRR